MVLRSSDRISRVPPYLIRPIMLPIRDCHPLWSGFPTCSGHILGSAGPRSLAATEGVAVAVLSSGYLDVSVHRVCSTQAWYYVFNIVGCPIRISTDQFVCANPRSFSQLITSFFASESLGILHTPLFSLLYFLLFYSE